MRISDWSSDVCSSDLGVAGGVVAQAVAEDLRGAMFLVEGDIEQRAAVVGPDGTSLRLLDADGQQRPACEVLHIDAIALGAVADDGVGQQPVVWAVLAGGDPEVALALGLAVAVEQHFRSRLAVAGRASAEHRMLPTGFEALVIREGPVEARNRAVVLLDSCLHLGEALLPQALGRRHGRLRSDERRGGQAGVLTCRFLGSP